MGMALRGRPPQGDQGVADRGAAEAVVLLADRRLEVGDETGGSVINGKPENDIIYYGLVLGPTEEWGYFSARELEMDERVEKLF